MRISDWSSDVCSSDLGAQLPSRYDQCRGRRKQSVRLCRTQFAADRARVECGCCRAPDADRRGAERRLRQLRQRDDAQAWPDLQPQHGLHIESILGRSEEHTSELQSLMRISYAVFCLKKKQETKL